MKTSLFAIPAFLLTVAGAFAIPQNFGGNFFGATFQPRDINEDLTEKLLDAEIWQGGGSATILEDHPFP